MSRLKHSTRKAKSVATLDVERKIASSKRTLQDVQRIIDQAKKEERSRRGGELVGKIPAMFLSVPTSVIGGAEQYFQEILASVPKAFNYLFGKNKGARQIQIEMFRAFERSRDIETQEQIDYITLASSVGVLVAYHLSQAVSGLSSADVLLAVKEAIADYQAEFCNPNGTIKGALDKVLSYNRIPAGGSAAVKISVATGISRLDGLIYPLNPGFISARDKMQAKNLLTANAKADFLLKNEVLNAYRRYAIKHLPKDSVALPSQIVGNKSALVNWFKNSPQYSLEDTFKYYKEAFNAQSGSRSAHRQQAIKEGIRVLKKSFDKFVEALRDSLYGSDSVSEAIELKNNFFDVVTESAVADDFVIANLLLQQAKSASPLGPAGTIDIAAMGYNTLSNLDLIDLLAETNASNVSAADRDVWDAFRKIEDLTNDLNTEVLSTSEKDRLENALEEARREIALSPLDNVTNEFKKSANDALDSLLENIVDTFNTGFSSELSSGGKLNGKPRVGQLIADSLNEIFAPYLKSGRSFTASVTGTTFTKLVKGSSQFSDASILSLAEGDSLDFFNEATDEFASRDVELNVEELRSEMIKVGLGSLFSEIENYIVDSAIEAQVIFDAFHFEMERDPDIAIFNNPALSMGMQAGLGVGALIGTHAVTALAQRLANSEGKTSGGAFYAAESIPALLAIGAGAYHWHQDRQDIAIPVIGGAIGSILLRVLTRKFNSSALRYLGAGPAAIIGDKTFGYDSWSAVSKGEPKSLSGFGDYLDTGLIQQTDSAYSGYIGSDALDGYIGSDGLDGYIGSDGLDGYISTDGLDGYIGDDGLDGYIGDDGLGGYIGDDGLGGITFSGDDSLIGTVDVGSIPSQNWAMQGLDHGDDVHGLGRYVDTPIHDPFYTYNPPTQTSFEQASAGMQIPQMYAAPAGYDAGLSGYVESPIHDPFFTYNPPTEVSFDQASRMMQQGGGPNTAYAGYDEEVVEILEDAQPLTSQEIMQEGLKGYVTEMILKVSPASASKLQNAGAGNVVGQSRTTPGALLMHIAAGGEEGPIRPEYNPSLPSGTFRPQQIQSAHDEEIVTSGLFSRGAFASRLPSSEEGYDY